MEDTKKMLDNTQVKTHFKLKKVEFVNKLAPGQPTQYKVAMVTPVIIGFEKFLDNVILHTGLHRVQVMAVLNAIEECAGDYLEIGNAVQLGENLGTIKPVIKVKAVDNKKDCNADTVMGLNVRFYPTGRMRVRLGSVGFSVLGESDGSDVDDSDVEVNTGGNTENGGSSGENTGGSTGGSTADPTGGSSNGGGSGSGDDIGE